MVNGMSEQGQQVTGFRMPGVYADGHEMRAEWMDGNRWRVFAGKTFVGGIERRGESDWRLSVVFVPDENLGSVLKAVPETMNGPYELAQDAATELATAFGMSVEVKPITFREMVEADIDMTPEQKAHWLGVCDAEGV